MFYHRHEINEQKKSSFWFMVLYCLFLFSSEGRQNKQILKIYAQVMINSMKKIKQAKAER